MLACVTDHKPAGNAKGTRRWVLALERDQQGQGEGRE